MSKAIWVIKTDKNNWFPRKKDAETFADNNSIDRSEIAKCPIGSYLDPRQLVQFLNDMKL
jgi:hypothetical protein